MFCYFAEKSVACAVRARRQDDRVSRGLELYTLRTSIKGRSRPSSNVFAEEGGEYLGILFRDYARKHYYLRLFYGDGVHAAEVERAQFLSLPIDDVQRRFRAEFHFHETTVVRVQPLAHDHLVDADTAVAAPLNRLLQYLQPAPSSVLQLHQPVTRAGAQNRHESEEYANVDVDEFATLRYFPKKNPPKKALIHLFLTLFDFRRG